MARPQRPECARPILRLPGSPLEDAIRAVCESVQDGQVRDRPEPATRIPPVSTVRLASAAVRVAPTPVRAMTTPVPQLQLEPRRRRA